MAFISMTRDKFDAIREKVAQVAFTPEQMQDPELSTWYQGWNSAVKAVNEILGYVILTEAAK